MRYYLKEIVILELKNYVKVGEIVFLYLTFVTKGTTYFIYFYSYFSVLFIFAYNPKLLDVIIIVPYYIRSFR